MKKYLSLNNERLIIYLDRYDKVNIKDLRYIDFKTLSDYEFEQLENHSTGKALKIITTEKQKRNDSIKTKK